MSFGIIAVILILIVATVYFTLYVVYPSTGTNEVLSTITPLNAKKDVVMPDVTQTTLLGTNGSTVFGYFKFLNGDRTPNYTNNYIPFLQIANNWYLEISNAPNDKKQSAARLRIKTKHVGAPLEDEVIDLPPIPKQKWVFIAVLREGRRFDVIYDNKIVASQRLKSYPAIITSPLSVGGKGLDGSVTHVTINGVRMTPNDIERVRLSLVDSNNTVPEDNPINMSLPSISLITQCPAGLPCEPVTRPPTNQLLQWNSPYA
jgi:hypothetical protein